MSVFFGVVVVWNLDIWRLRERKRVRESNCEFVWMSLLLWVFGIFGILFVYFDFLLGVGVFDLRIFIVILFLLLDVWVIVVRVRNCLKSIVYCLFGGGVWVGDGNFVFYWYWNLIVRENLRVVKGEVYWLDFLGVI